MALFQQSVITKHLQSLDQKLLDKKWNDFTTVFHNAEKQTNIKNSKEEQYQEGFLRDLFVQIFGYTINPETNFNLLTEQKNQSNSKKADGAILIDGKVKAVIELKGTDTSDLNKIETQAFGYKNNQPECVYVITSNFERIRFYIDNAVEFLEFNLFSISRSEFDLLYSCISYDSIKKDIPKYLKDESVTEEKRITKELYFDYSQFKKTLYENLVVLNPKYDKLLLFKKTQKLLDRFLFIFFAEDRQLVPTNLIRRINIEWDNLQKMRINVSLYERYKMYFEDLNKGATVTLPAFGKTNNVSTEEFKIFAYNGGLFIFDEILDNVKIHDKILYEYSEKLSTYDFESDVDVNILGHIFENSLNEIDEIKSEIEGKEIDKTKTRRKKDGVFYTPKYITKYIVDNTIGKLCEEKKTEFQIIDEEFAKGRKNRNKSTIEKLDKSLHAYRDWLLQITICDPACGSGAFLNQALEFLIQEHKYIDSLESQLLGYSFEFPGTEIHILENNIYGVDLNDESVEIAKLSLWLRTAQKGRKLNSLNNNIKCGNSLIDDVAVAGDKAFSWEKEFPEVFEKGGFDVVIGNPPYVQSTSLDEKVKTYIYQNYSTSEYQINTYGIFMEKTFDIIKNNSVYGLIIPNYWISTKFDSKLRNLIFNVNHAFELINTYQIFEDANVDTVMLIGKKTETPLFPKETLIKGISNKIDSIDNRLKALEQSNWNYNESYAIKSINHEVHISFQNGIKLISKNKLDDYIKGFKGMQPYEKGKGFPLQTREMMDNKIYHSDKKIDESYFPLIGAGNVQRYLLKKPKEYIKYGNNLAAPRKIEIFSQPRILINRILSKEKIDLVFVEETMINNTDVFNFIPKKEIKINPIFFLAILGSKLCASFFKTNNVNLDRTAFPKLNVNNILSFPLPNIFIIEEQDVLIKKSSSMLDLTNKLLLISQKFSTYFSNQYKIEKLSGKLEKWYELEFTDFIKELNKSIKTVGGLPLTKKDEFDWIDLFEENKKKAMELKSEIDKTDKEIDQMVYELYGLSEEEIKIVEGN